MVHTQCQTTSICLGDYFLLSETHPKQRQSVCVLFRAQQQNEQGLKQEESHNSFKVGVLKPWHHYENSQEHA